MAIRWEDMKEKTKEILNEFKGQRVGIVGLGIIVLLLMVGIFAPVIAPDIIGRWEDTDRWRDVPNGVPPTWWDYFTSDDLSPQEVMTEPDEIEREDVYVWEDLILNYTYDYQYEEPPTNLALYLDGTWDNQTEAGSLQVDFIRPDGEELTLVDRAVNIERGSIDERFSLIGRNRDKIYYWAEGLGVHGDHVFDMGLEYEPEEEGEVPDEIKARFLEEDIDLDEMLFNLDREEFEEYLQEGPMADELIEEFEEEDITFYESLFMLDRQYQENEEPRDYEDLFRDEPFVHENHTIREVFDAQGQEISEDARLIEEEENLWWISQVEYDEDDPEEYEVIEKEYRIEIAEDLAIMDDALEIFEIDAELEQEGDVWWVVSDDDREYRIETTADDLEIYPFLEVTRDNDNWYISVGIEDYRIEVHEDELKVYLVPDIPRERVNHQRTLFGKADEDILSPKPNPLQGEYQIRVSFVSEDQEFSFGEDSGRLIIMGSMYGWMGTDNRGRDIGAGWVWGARYALLLGAIIAGTTISIGTLFGMTSAYLGGWKDEFMQRINEIVIGIPILPILIIMMFIWRQSFWVMVALMSILYWRGIAKTIRARGLQIRQSTYVEAAQSLGAGSGRVITTHMVPQILPYSMAEGALLVPVVVITEASLSVLGLGDPQLVTWGKLLSQAQGGGATIRGLWWWVLLPGLGITMLGFGFIASGMAIERIVNPKMQQR